MEDYPLCVSKILPWREQGAGHSLAKRCNKNSKMHTESLLCDTQLFSVYFVVFGNCAWTWSRARTAARWPSSRLKPSPYSSSPRRSLGMQPKEMYQPVPKRIDLWTKSSSMYGETSAENSLKIKDTVVSNQKYYWVLFTSDVTPSVSSTPSGQ